MARLIELNEERYTEFVKTHKYKSHFLQSYEWGQFAKEKKNLTPYYLGLLDKDENVIAACLLLKKSLPLGYSYFYSPRGFVINFSDFDLLKEMTNKVLEYTKKHKSLFIKIDPDIIIKKYNYKDEEIPIEDYDVKKIFTNLKSIGFRHQGFTKNFETSQPRYSFRIDLKQDLDTIRSHFSKTTKQRINKAEKLDTEVILGDESDIEEFFHLMNLTETRKDFISYSSSDYYKCLYKIFKKHDMVDLFMGKIHIENSIKILEDNKKKIDSDIETMENKDSKNSKNKLKEFKRQQENLKEQIERLENAKEKYGDTVTLSGHMIIRYNDKAWVLYAGNHNILSETYVNYKTYFTHLKHCKDLGLKIYDQFGTIGDLRKDNPVIGLHEFKKKFGGDYVEFIGEFDYIQKPFMYFIFNKLVPFYRNIVKRRAKKEINDEVSRTK